MVINGLKPLKRDVRDFSVNKTFGTTGVFPDSYNTDAGLTMPDQMAPNLQFTPPIPPLPAGCTDYASSELCIDEDKQLYSPLALEAVTHANQNGGCDMRYALACAVSVYNRAAYFAVEPTTDWFDGIRSAIMMLNRSVSIGTPWMSEWMSVQEGIIPDVFVYSGHEPWHNHKICGWKTINGEPYLVDKSWQGENYGDHGWAYFSRPTVNAVMEIAGTGAYTLAPLAGANVQTITAGKLEQILALIWGFLGA